MFEAFEMSYVDLNSWIIVIVGAILVDEANLIGYLYPATFQGTLEWIVRRAPSWVRHLSWVKILIMDLQDPDMLVV